MTQTYQQFKIGMLEKQKNFKIKIANRSKDYFFISLGRSSIVCSRQSTINPLKILEITIQNKAYVCGFIRFISLNYFTKLKYLLKHIELDKNSNDQLEWPCLYQIISFEPDYNIFKRLNPVYGTKIFFRNNGKLQQSCFSNAFRYEDETFYFIQNNTKLDKKFNVLTNGNQKLAYGISFSIKQTILCLPFQLFTSNQPISLQINPFFKGNLQKTVYLQHNGDYCTGTLIQSNLILTVRHLFNSKPSIGTIISVRLYPYKVKQSAKLIKISDQGLDIALIQLISVQIQKQNNQMVFSDHQQPVSVSDMIHCIGFGRFSYNKYVFEELQLVLPTITHGIISKKIEFHNKLIFFKTDASLINGFSGCSLWKEERQVGIVVFIIKNLVSLSKLNRQNFSYSINFIAQKFLNPAKKQLTSSQRQYISLFDRISTRKALQFSKL